MASLLFLPVIFIAFTPVIQAVDAGAEIGGKFGYISGASRQENTIVIVQGFPSTRDFFEKYVFESKPVVMKGAAKSTPAYQRWKTDEYFHKLDLPEDELFTVETMKKENRTQEILELNFREFLNTYEKEERYMVHRVPPFLGQDVLVPEPLQCEDIIQNSIVEAIMWFSSGGTKSVVHTDSVDNMNCVYVGSKHFVMIDPHKDAGNVFFDHPEGAYSDIDVDNVNYEKYPGLRSVEYQHVDLEEGDCLYIPYKWIHQVRSYGPRNLAINIWWDTYRNEDVDFARCNLPRDRAYTLNDVDYIGFNAVFESLDAVADQFYDFTRHQDLPMEKYAQMMLGERDPGSMGAGQGYMIPIRQLFQIIDKNGDGLMSHDEVSQGWEEVQKQMSRFDAILAALDDRWEQEQLGDSTLNEHDEL